MNQGESVVPVHVRERVVIEHEAEIPTWFGVGGRARRLARPRTLDELRQCLEIDPALRVLGDGANLLVSDSGVDELVVALTAPDMRSVMWDEARGRVIAMAGASLPRLVAKAASLGLAGLEGLGGIPATVGGAVVMNAGGRFGQIADVVACVHVLTRDGREVRLARSDIPFDYRHSGLGDSIVLAAELQLTHDAPAAIRRRLMQVMAYKKRTQPLAARSAGCCFRNPVLPHDIDQIGHAGERVSAGRLIEHCGCRGLTVGGAAVSGEHANFLVVRPGARARDVLELMDLVAARVYERLGVRLEREVVVWPT